MSNTRAYRKECADKVGPVRSILLASSEFLINSYEYFIAIVRREADTVAVITLLFSN